MPSLKTVLPFMVALIALLAVGATPARAVDTRDIGGPGGGWFRDECQAGDVLVGVNVRAGKDVNSVGGVCRPVRDGRVVDQPYGLKTWGTKPDNGSKFANGDLGNPWCFGDNAVFSIQATVSAHNTIHQFLVGCRDVVTGAESESVLSQVYGGQGHNMEVTGCQPGQIATGLKGRSGALVDALGLICSPIPAPKPVKPQKPIKSTGKSGGGLRLPASTLSCQGGDMKVTISTDQTAAFITFTPAAQTASAAAPGAGECAWSDRSFADNEPHRLALDLGKPNARQLLDAARSGGTFQVTANPVGTFTMVKSVDAVQGAGNGGNNTGGGNGGGGASAATDTTVYDQPAGNEIAYLSAGDPVSVVSCNGNNWCQISKPRKGWVWGDDLNR